LREDKEQIKKRRVFMLENCSVILVRPQQSGNIGGVARSISNHGLRELIVVDPPNMDVEQARWMAPHAKDVIDNMYYTPDVRQAVEESHIVYGTTARKRSWDIPHLDLNMFLEHVHQQVKNNQNIRISLLFGPEDSGLSNKDLSFCQYTVALPTAQNASLNLSQAVNVFGSQLLHYFNLKDFRETLSDNNITDTSLKKPVSQKIFHSITERSLDILDASGYLQAKNPIQIRHQILRFLSQSQLSQTQISQQDISIISGMINKVYHKLRILGEIKPTTKTKE
jgi:tRNA/rRNA methyltransferase